MADDKTNIQVSDELWEKLNRNKRRGDTFEDVIWRLIEDGEGDPD